VWIKGGDINTEVGFSDDFRVEITDRAYLFGEVRVRRGRVDVFGRRFDLQNDSVVRFTGPPSRPALDVTAQHENEREGVNVSLHVTGEVGEIKLQPTSTPPLSESEIYTLLATGRRNLKRSATATSPSGQAASFLGSMAASQLKKAISSNLPLDVFSIEAGDEGGLQGTRLEAGTYINDQFYVGFQGRIGADPMKGENANAVRLEYQLSRRWSLEAEYGDARSGSADLIWTKEY
jgi:translocation and assembly module TamB